MSLPFSVFSEESMRMAKTPFYNGNETRLLFSLKTDN